jgi:5-methylcytosine-specific restriction protein A
MPIAAPKPCAQPGCGVLVRDGSSRCEAHKVLPGRFADRRRGSRHERGYGNAWDRLRERILTRDGGLCQPCQRADRVTAATEVDHVVNKADGGTDDDTNLQAICRDCHRAKTAEEARRGRGA